MPSGKKAAAQQGFDELKLKYLTVDRNYETLKTLTRRALFEFDQLKKKSKEDVVMLEKERKSNEDISKELEEIQAEHEKLKETSARAFDEYGELVTRFEKQQELKEKAESLATNLSHESKVLKRNLESKTQLGATENQKLIAQLEEITMENSTLKQEVDDLKESMEYLTKKYGDKEKDHVTLVRAFSSATEKVAEMEKEKEDKVLVDRGTFERLQKASEMALEEINSLSEKLESEQRLRREAEHIAHQNLTEANALKRQSAIVLSSVIEEQQLTEALMEVESLNNKIAELEKESKDKITDLQSELEGLQESTLLEENRKLEEKLSLVTAEAESLATNSHASEQKVVELQTKVVDYEQQITDLNQKVEEAQQAAAAASTSNAANEDAVGGAPPPPPGPPPPPPPPPPAAPPPPPPPPPPTTTSLSNLIKVKKPASSPSTERKATIGKAAAEDPMAEMLARIKSGNVHLRKIEAATSEKKKPENDIMAEMSKLLASGKRPGGRSRVPPSTKPKPKPSDSQVSGELAAMLKRRKKKQGEDVTDKGKAAEEETSSREASVEPAEEVVDEDKKDAQDEKEAKDVEDKEGKQDNETAPAEGTTDKERKFATVKERMDTLERVKVRKHAPLEKKTSSKVKIPDVFQSPQHSPLTAHKSPITDVSIHVSYSQDDDDTFEPTSNTDQNVDKTGDSKVDDQGEDQPAATESTTASTDHASDEAITDKEPQVEEQQPAGQVTEEPSTSTPQENKPAEQEQDSKHTEQEQDSKHTEQVEQDTKPVEQADQYVKPVEHVGQDEPPPEMSTKTVDQTEEVESKEEQSTESTNQQISDEGTVTTEGDKETEKVQEQATDEKTTEGDQPNAPSDEVDETANQPED